MAEPSGSRAQPGDVTSQGHQERPSTPGLPSRVLVLTGVAILFRLVLFLGRGDYLAFDEGWYLLLGRSLFIGEGYSLVGIPHITLSPLFPILAGAAGSLLGSWMWGGRVVAALSSGLLVLPAWFVFRRLAPARTAFTAVLLVAVLPSMAPFVVPFYIGADLWVGAEPLLHLFLFCGIALWLRAREGGSIPAWALAGGSFGLAFLARPEAIITWGLLGLAALGLAAFRRSRRPLLGAVAMGLGFALIASPYWIYLHGVTGRWSLTGRGVSATSNALKVVSREGRGGATSTIEGMLWSDDETYVQRLYGLDETGLRLRSDYWGVYPDNDGDMGRGWSGSWPASGSGPRATVGQEGGSAQEGGGPELEADPGPETSQGSVTNPGSVALPGAVEEVPVQTDTGPTQPSFLQLLVRAMETIFPGILWPLVFLGLLGPRAGRKPVLEFPVALALVGTSLAIALLVAVDPRTQLLLVPLLAFFLARGIAFLDGLLGPRMERVVPRPRFLQNLLVVLTVGALAGVSVTHLYMGLTYGSPHHVVGSQNRMVAEELDSVFHAPEGPLASWHPALAVFADRDWRVLPYADLPRIIRYAGASGASVMVLSAYYPPFRGEEILGTRYLVVPVPRPPPEDAGRWTLRSVRGDTLRALGELDWDSGG